MTAEAADLPCLPAFALIPGSTRSRRRPSSLPVLPLDACDVRRLASLLCDECPSRVEGGELVAVVRDVVAVEHGVGLVARHPHRDRLGNATTELAVAAFARKSSRRGRLERLLLLQILRMPVVANVFPSPLPSPAGRGSVAGEGSGGSADSFGVGEEEVFERGE